MKPPKFTDSSRYPHGYRKSTETDIRRTFERARRQIKESDRKVVTFKRTATGGKA